MNYSYSEGHILPVQLAILHCTVTHWKEQDRTSLLFCWREAGEVMQQLYLCQQNCLLLTHMPSLPPHNWWSVYGTKSSTLWSSMTSSDWHWLWLMHGKQTCQLWPLTEQRCKVVIRFVFLERERNCPHMTDQTKRNLRKTCRWVGGFSGWGLARPKWARVFPPLSCPAVSSQLEAVNLRAQVGPAGASRERWEDSVRPRTLTRPDQFSPARMPTQQYKALPASAHLPLPTTDLSPGQPGRVPDGVEEKMSVLPDIVLCSALSAGIAQARRQRRQRHPATVQTPGLQIPAGDPDTLMEPLRRDTETVSDHPEPSCSKRRRTEGGRLRSVAATSVNLREKTIPIEDTPQGLLQGLLVLLRKITSSNWSWRHLPFLSSLNSLGLSDLTDFITKPR